MYGPAQAEFKDHATLARGQFLPEVSQPLEVILRDSTGSKIGVLALDYLLSNLGYYHVRFNKRGNIKHAIRKERTALSPLSNNGTGFRQMLDAGPVWALKGTPGSQKAQAVA